MKYMNAELVYRLAVMAAAVNNAVVASSSVDSAVPSNDSSGDGDNQEASAVASSPADGGGATATSSCSDADNGSCSSISPHQDHYYCVNTSINSQYEILGNHDCFYDDILLSATASTTSTTTKTTNITKLGDFVSPKLQPGQVTPILWRRNAPSSVKNNNNNGNNDGNTEDDDKHGGKIVSQYAFQIGLPSQLVPTLLNYTSSLGIIDKFRELTTTSPIPYHDTGNATADDRHNGQFITFGTHRWYAQRPAKKWSSNMHWISPADEYTHEEYLHTLFTHGHFHELLDSIGKAIQLDGVVAYHLTFLAVSHSVAGYLHHDTTETGGRVYNVIIPLLVEEDDNIDDGGGGSVEPELILIDDMTGQRGGYKYQVGTAALMGDDVIHGTLECDYTTSRRSGEWKHGGIMANGKRSGMRLAATIYIADINELNVKDVAERTLTQIFPMADQDWLYAQRGRHWVAYDLRGGGDVEKDDDEEEDEEKENGSLETTMGGDMIDKGRERFWFDDEFEDCDERAKEGMCESDEEITRKMCLKACNIYIEDGPTLTKKLDDDGYGDDESMFEICTQNRTGVETCTCYEDDTDVDGDFVIPKKKLESGEMFPFIWREDGKQTTPYAFQVGLPPELTIELRSYCDELGMTDLFRELVGDDPIEANEDGMGHNGEFVTLTDGNRWYAQRPEKKWSSNMHWISPADEKTHEEYIKVLARGNFDAVLDGIGRYLGLESLVAYHLTFLAVSHSEVGFIHRDTHSTGASVYNVIIPLILDDEALPELAMEDWDDESRRGTLKYQIGTASMMGDDAMHGTQACDYREKKGMRMAATVYIADIQLMNYEQITKGTLTQIFPLPDEDWLWAQRGRHWGGGNSLKTDKGREKFSVSDHRSDCYERAEQDMCESDVHGTRKKCLKSCKVYEGDNSGDEDWYVESFDPEIQYEEWYYLTQFFNMAWDYKCVDSSDQCEDFAERGLCLTDPDHMKELGCHRSCLFCFSSDSVDLYSLGETQLFESDDDDAHEKETPSHMDVLEIIVKTEQYLANKVFVAPDHEHVRLACRNYDAKCAIWAAQGFCEDDRGFMGKNCPVACQDCLMVDYKMRCPFDEEEANIFGPGELNNMFERILEECGEDPSTFSPENLPSGGTHPFGEVKVISSPYDNMIEYLNEEDIPKIDQFSPVPWMLLMEGFLSEEECDKLIELGKINGYERSTIDGDSDIGGEVAYAESEDRTSENSFCGDGCNEDPIVKRVLEKMVAITGIPDTNYEDLQLVRYEVGQFYNQHHDYSESMAGTVPGHRILTFFMYLNDVEDGGGTKFEDLNFIAKPKRGSALIWPSVTDANLDQIEEWTYHEALPVTKGIKYGANAWIHLRDFQNAPEYC